MKKISIIFILLVLIFIGVHFPRQNVQASIFDFFYKVKDVLSVSGNRTVLNDQEVLLRGVAVGDPHSRVVEEKRDKEDYVTIKNDWRANVVRVSVHPGLFKKDEGKTKELLEDEIEAIRKNGLFVIVDWHVVGTPDGWYKSWDWGQLYGYSYDSNFNQARDFWKYMAIEYRSDRGVMFEIWNEPASNKNLNWGGVKDYMERLYEIIRSQGAENIVIAPGVWWAYDLRDIKNNPLKGYNIGYSWHDYPGSEKYLERSKALDDLNQKYPIFVTEWGFSTNTNGRSHHYASLDDWPLDFKNYLLGNNLNFTAWCWHDSWDPRMFESGWARLTDFGKFIKNFLISIDNGLAYLKLDDQYLNQLRPGAQQELAKFIKDGVDGNSRGLGEGERRAVIFSFQKAFDRLPGNNLDMEDVVKIVNGRWPSQRSESAEEDAKERFKNIYKREINFNNKYDVSAMMIMAYGLKQRAENRNLNSEKVGIMIYKSIFGSTPSSTEDWNVMQAITYSGARR